MARQTGVAKIEWEEYKGEEVIVNTVIRGGQRVFEKEFFEDKVKAMENRHQNEIKHLNQVIDKKFDDK